jgi:uncharacterized membrane protein (DUF106 family)
MRKAVALALLLVFAVLAFGPYSGGAYAQGGLDESLGSGCVLATVGQTASNAVTVTWPGGPTSNVTLTLLGSHPTDIAVTFAPAEGKAPFTSSLELSVGNTSAAPASYQLGVLAQSGSSEKLVLFTLRVVKPGTVETCSPVGLPIPDSTFLVTATSLGLGLLTQIVTTQVVNLEAERRMKVEVNAFNKEKRAATLAKDQAKLEKLKKREPAVRQEQAKISLARMKVSFVTIVPLFLVYYLMATFLGGYGTIVAITPFPNILITGSHGEMVLFWWYFLSSFAFSSILSRLLHTTT